ncbi:MAG: hypothetical protein KDE51_08290, partial [Anaerolineales bacterium]|nr:hypothetical protein [Anaerolineales bacterium]
MPFLSQSTIRYVIILIFASSLFVTACQDQPTPPAAEPTPAATTASQAETDQLVMAEYVGEKSFEMLYPASWIYQLPRVGFLIFAGEETLNQAQPGPQMSVLRVPIAQVHGNAEGEL